MNIRKTLIALLILTMIMATSACGSTVPETTPGNNPDYKVAMVTDSGDITDQSFNQITYTAMAEYCEENHIDYTYKKPDGDTDYARIAMVDVAVAEGDIIAAAVGGIYYSNPDAYTASDYYNTGNTYCAVYREEIPGYMAGYTAVRLGYRKLGYLGGQSVPAVMRFGYGYLQGIDAAAKDLGVTDDVEVQYAYGGQFYGSTEITAAMDTWFTKGTEIVFACGGGIFTSAAEAAAKVNGKIIGVDSDQSGIIDAYGKGMTVTSAMKGLGATVKAMLNSIIFDNTWNEHVGKIENLGLVSGTDMSVNYVGLPEETTLWNDDFTVDDYHELVNKIYTGENTVDSSIDKVPDVSVKVNMREGTIM